MSYYEIVLPTTGDRVEAEDERSVLAAARALVDDADQWVGRSRLLRRELIVARDGRYDGPLTEAARRG